MSRKVLESAGVKAVSTATQQRTLDFYMLAFSNAPDKQGDIIARDAADGWLKSFYAAGVPLAISFTHSAMMDPGDPFNIIGQAPADPAHVFKDAHGIRVIADLDVDTNPIAAQVYSLAKRRVVTGASVFFMMSPDAQKVQKDGSTLITRIDDIIECGPCLDPANEDAYIVAVKAMADAQRAREYNFDEAYAIMKAGRAVSAARMAKLEALLADIDEARSEIVALIDGAKIPATENQTEEANADEPQANADEPEMVRQMREQLAEADQLLAAAASEPLPG